MQISLIWDHFELIFLYSVKIDAQVNSDGSVDVVEQRTYDFDGSFSWATMWIPEAVTRQGYEYRATITDFSVSA